MHQALVSQTSALCLKKGWTEYPRAKQCIINTLSYRDYLASSLLGRRKWQGRRQGIIIVTHQDIRQAKPCSFHLDLDLTGCGFKGLGIILQPPHIFWFTE